MAWPARGGRIGVSGACLSRLSVSSRGWSCRSRRRRWPRCTGWRARWRPPRAGRSPAMRRCAASPGRWTRRGSPWPSRATKRTGRPTTWSTAPGGASQRHLAGRSHRARHHGRRRRDAGTAVAERGDRRLQPGGARLRAELVRPLGTADGAGVAAGDLAQGPGPAVHPLRGRPRRWRRPPPSSTDPHCCATCARPSGSPREGGDHRPSRRWR